jgi:hypothetical protein
MGVDAAESPIVNPESPAPCSLTPVPSNQSLNPEARAAALIASLEQQASEPTDLATLSDHLSLLRRWYYRPERHRTGEVFFPKEDSAAANRESAAVNSENAAADMENAAANKETAWPIRRILNGAARLALGDPKPLAETQRDLATRNPADAPLKPTRTKTLHEGRPDVERTVPALDTPPTFKSRRKSRPT